MSTIPPAATETPALPVVDAAFFDNILETDLANIINKATRGLPLTARERDMIAEERSRLTKLPPATAVTFELEASGPGMALESMTQKELAGEWGVSLRTIKGWLAEGSAATDPAPLTKPDLFPAWFARVHAPRQCPDKYQLAAQRILAGVKTAKATTPPPAAEPAERVAIADDAKGLLAMLERYRETEARLGLDYMKAVDSGDEVRASFLLSQWSNIGEKLRALEKIAPKALEELGIYVRKDEIQRELEPLHRAIIKAFRQEFRMSRPKLRATKTAEEWNLLTDDIVSGVSSMLTNTEFREPLMLEVA